MRLSVQPVISAKSSDDARTKPEQFDRLKSVLFDPEGATWEGLLSALRDAGATVKSQNGEVLVSIGFRHVLMPKMRSSAVAVADLAFLSQGLGLYAVGKPLQPTDPTDVLRLAVAIDDQAAQIYRATLPPMDGAPFIALAPYDRHLFVRHSTAGETVMEMDGAYFEWLSMVLAPARQILLVERGASTAGTTLLHFLRRHHPPIAARLACGAAFGTPSGTDIAFLALARRHLMGGRA